MLFIYPSIHDKYSVSEIHSMEGEGQITQSFMGSPFTSF